MEFWIVAVVTVISAVVLVWVDWLNRRDYPDTGWPNNPTTERQYMTAPVPDKAVDLTVPTVNWAHIAAVLSALAGVVGVVLVPLVGTKIAGDLKLILTSLSAILVIIGGVTANKIVHMTAKARLLAGLPVGSKL